MLLKYAFLLFLSIHITSGYDNINITSIPNSQTRNQKSADLAEVPVQDVEVNQKENKLNANGERILRRKIAPTDLNLGGNTTSKNGNDTLALKIATEGSGVTKLSVVKDNLKTDTNSTAKAIVAEHHIEIANSTKILGNTPISPFNGTGINTRSNGTMLTRHGTIKSTPAPQIVRNTSSSSYKPETSYSTKPNSLSTTTTTTTTTATTTKTTPKPKKPTITYSVEDMPEIAIAVSEHSSSSKLPTESKHISPKLSVDEPEQPIAQPSQEFSGGLYRNHRDYIIPIVSIIFAVPILMGMVIVAYRRIRDFWSTRHYRRMDFLVDGMYND